MPTIAALLRNRQHAMRAVSALERFGLGPEQIGVLAREDVIGEELPGGVSEGAERRDEAVRDLGAIGAANAEPQMFMGLYPVAHAGLGAALAAGTLAGVHGGPLAGEGAREAGVESAEERPRRTSVAPELNDEDEVASVIKQERAREESVDREAAAARERVHLHAEDKEQTLARRLMDMGVSSTDADCYTEGVRRGAVLLTVDATQDATNRVRDILREAKAVDVGACQREWERIDWERAGPQTPPAR